MQLADTILFPPCWYIVFRLDLRLDGSNVMRYLLYTDYLSRGSNTYQWIDDMFRASRFPLRDQARDLIKECNANGYIMVVNGPIFHN